MFHVASSCVTKSVFLFAPFHISSCGFQVSCFETWTWKEHWWGLNPEPVFFMHQNLLCYPYTTGNCWWLVKKASYISKTFHVSCISVCTVSYFKLRVSSCGFQVSCWEKWTWKGYRGGLNPEPVFQAPFNLLFYLYTTADGWWHLWKASYITNKFHVSCIIILCNTVSF